VCNEQLTQHPGQALFQSLKLDVEERQRQERSQVIAEVDRQVETEADLEKRVSILAQALERCPGEAHFERALRTMREKRDLMNSIVGKAQSYEERGQYADALSQWEILKTIYSQYPGLDFEVERVRRRRDQQLRSDAKAKWVEQIDWLLGAGDYASAGERLRSAAAEFPDDPELMELEKLATQAASRAAEAQKLLVEGQDAAAERRFAEAIEILRRAHQIDDRNSVIRAALTGTLLEHARNSLDPDWRLAGELAQQAIQLDPSNVEAKSLCALAMDRQREESVERCVTQVRRLQTEGQLHSALQQAQAALGEFPNEPRLLQLRSTLMRAYSEGRIGEDTQTIAASSPEWAELPPVRPPQGTTIVIPVPGEEAAPKTPRAAARPVEEKVEPATVETRAAARPIRYKIVVPAIAAGVAATILLVGALIVMNQKRAQPAHVAPQPAPAAVAVAPAIPAPVSPALLVRADIEGGRLVLDDQPVGELEGGQLVLKELTPGTHTLKIGGFREQATIRFEVEKGAEPVVESLTAKEAVAITVTNHGGHGKVEASIGSGMVSVDGTPVGEMGSAGVELNGLAPGNHELTIGDGKERQSVGISAGDAPTLTAFLKSDRSVGTLVVVTGEDGVHVWLNGKEQRRQTQKGQLRIAGLDARGYTLRVAKDGFQDTPEQQVSLRKGEEVRLEFQLRPALKVGALSLAGGIPGTEVLLDQTPIGLVRDDGGFATTNISPGDHVIELRRDSYRGRKIEKHFDTGGTVQLSAADAALEKLPGTIRINVTPADARLSISRPGEGAKPVAGQSVVVAEGSYTLTASAPNHGERSVTFSVAAGETKNVDLILSRILAPVGVRGMSDWEDPAGWVLANNWYTRKGGNFVLYKPTTTSGVFVFTIELRKGKRLQWVAQYTNDANYALFQMDKRTYYRLQVNNGKETQMKKAPHGLDKQNAYTVEIDVAPGRIVHKLWDGSKWMILDDWQEAGRTFSNGKFGFLLPGSDTFTISNFSFTPK